MVKTRIPAAAATAALILAAGTAAAVPAPRSVGAPQDTMLAAGSAEAGVIQVQYGGGGRRWDGYGARRYAPPRNYRPPGYAPRYYGGPPRAWGYRPWYRRPYYGTIIGGIALGTIIGVTAYGLAPRPPRPDLCWYWADEYQSRGYWDYC